MVERDSKETPLLSIPGKWTPEAWTMYPVVASIATRECLSSAARNQAKVSSDPMVARLRGSNCLKGMVLPGMPSSPMLRAVEEAICEAGAKAAAELARARKRPATFIVISIFALKERNNEATFDVLASVSFETLLANVQVTRDVMFLFLNKKNWIGS